MSDGEEFRDLGPIFEPKSVALIGASNNPLKWGWVILSNILSHGYVGSVYPVNPKEDDILGLKTYKTIFEITKKIDLAIVVRPAENVPQHIEECVEKEVKSAIVLAGGFRETGKEGEELEREVVEIARKGNLLVVGPNTMGVYSAPVSLLAIMSPISVVKGEVSFISMSGNIGVNLLSMGSTENMGFNKFVSIGRRHTGRVPKIFRRRPGNQNHHHLHRRPTQRKKIHGSGGGNHAKKAHHSSEGWEIRRRS